MLQAILHPSDGLDGVPRELQVDGLTEVRVAGIADAPQDEVPAVEESERLRDYMLASRERSRRLLLETVDATHGVPADGPIEPVEFHQEVPRPANAEQPAAEDAPRIQRERGPPPRTRQGLRPGFSLPTLRHLQWRVRLQARFTTLTTTG